MAARLNIPLVFYGESDAEYGTGPESRFETAERDMSFSSSKKDETRAIFILQIYFNLFYNLV